jgi:D-arabinose 1-dehydrogenase-like Zn-dependent alcohol dehydrogenase
VLVKISHSGVCHSDLHVMLGEWPWLPMADGQVGGHEGRGEGIEKTREVKGDREGGNMKKRKRIVNKVNPRSCGTLVANWRY